jgi:hypothetical protein
MNKRQSSGLIGIMIVVVITIFPLTQVMLLTLNGGLTYAFAFLFGAASKSGVTELTSIVLNSILATIGMIGFYLAEKSCLKMVSVFLIMFSGQMLVMFQADDFNKGDNYIQGWLTVSGIPILSILTITLAKHYTRKRKLKNVS